MEENGKTVTPRVSLILPVYNTKDYLGPCIDSIIGQTFGDWELLVVDDGSTDGSGAICDTYDHRDDRITVVHKLNTGKPDTLNLAIGMVKAEFVGFIDSDDWLEPDMLEVLLQALDSTRTDVASAGYLNEFADTVTHDVVCRQQTSITACQMVKLLYDRKLPAYLHGRLFRRTLLQEPVPQLRRYEDYAVIYKWISHGWGAVLCPQCLYHYRQRSSSIMNSEGDARLLTALIISDCYQFVRENRLLSEKSNKQIAACNFVRIAKTIARETKGSQCTGMLKKIRQMLIQIQPVSRTMVDGKTYRRMRQLLRSVIVFQLFQKISNLFVRGHREHHHVLFQ